MKLITLPGENEIDLDIAGNNDDEGEEEDLTVEDGVVEVSPLDGSEANEEGVGHIVNHYRGGQVLKEVECGALVEVLDWVLEHPEDDGLGGGEHQGQDPDGQHHGSGSLPLLAQVEGGEGVTDADVPEQDEDNPVRYDHVCTTHLSMLRTARSKEDKM